MNETGASRPGGQVRSPAGQPSSGVRGEGSEPSASTLAAIATELGCTSDEARSRLERIRAAAGPRLRSDVEAAIVLLASASVSRRTIATTTGCSIERVTRLLRARKLLAERAEPSRRPWSTDDDQRLAAIWPTSVDSETIAQMLGRSVPAVYARVADLKCAGSIDIPARRARWSALELERLRELHLKRTSYDEIAAALGRSVGSIASRLHQDRRASSRDPSNEAGASEIHRAAARFSSDEIAVLLESWGFVRKPQLAATFGCSVATLNKRLELAERAGFAFPPLRPGSPHDPAAGWIEVARLRRSPSRRQHRAGEVLVAVACTATLNAAAELLAMNTTAVSKRLERMRRSGPAERRLVDAALTAQARRRDAMTQARHSGVDYDSMAQERRHEALRLQREQHLTRAQIARELRLRPETVKKMLAKARREES